MSKQVQWCVKWVLDIEEEGCNSPVEAVRICWDRIVYNPNEWIWEVHDIQEGKTYEVDMEPEIPEVTEIKAEDDETIKEKD